jgi:ATP-dependent helicase HrpB
MKEPLPIDEYLPAILAGVRTHRAVVVTAAPGAGKTTRVPPSLTVDGRALLLQPRRVAARSIARRIASEQDWTIGREVGWHVRFDRRDSQETQLLVATEGILTARLQQDPLLSEFRTVVLDEFHERSIHADLGLALARQAWLARDDLRIVVMSATIDAGKVAAFLGDCPVVDVPGRLHPVEVSYRPGDSVDQVAADVLTTSPGAILCFLPGAAEIRRTAAALENGLSDRARVLPLYGGLDADAQDAALVPSAEPRIILATNIAETTLTVPDVGVVIDAGWQKVARYDAERGIDSLEIERISRDAADQRAGRAGRVRAGHAIRLWDARDRLRPHREPDIERVDIASVAMDVLAWGGDPLTLDWFEAPPPDALARAMDLLTSLGLVRGQRLTSFGDNARRLPLHPRLASFLLEARGARSAATACAILSERHFMPPARDATLCDLLAAVDRERDLPPHIRRVARDLEAAAKTVLGTEARRDIDDVTFRRSVFAGYRDRIGRRRAVGSDRFLLASGAGARLGRESGVVSADLIVAVDVASGGSRPGAAPAEAVIRIATAIEREWIVETSRTVEHVFDAAAGRVRATEVARAGAIVVGERDVEPEPAIARRLLLDAILARGPSEADEQLLNRLQMAGVARTFDSLAAAATTNAIRLADLVLSEQLPIADRRLLERLAPAELALPSGRRTRLKYHADGRVVASVKLQELFGLAESPRLGRSQVPVTFELLSPAGRPVQVTSDLKSFWANGYPEVRKELRARYPKHPWPDDPWTATPTHRTARRTTGD